MKKETIHIADMVCPRCISAVERIAKKWNLPLTAVELGSVSFNRELTADELSQFSEELNVIGFHIALDKKSRITSEIKTQIIQLIHHSDQELPSSWSEFLSQKLHREYSTLSKIFSRQTESTIEQFIIHNKIEHAKELLSHSEKSLKEIAHILDYSNSSHLSRQFKNITGQTTSEYKKANYTAGKKVLSEI